MKLFRVLRTNELAEILGVSRQTIWRMEDELPPKIKISGRVVGWDSRDIESWLNDRKQLEEIEK